MIVGLAREPWTVQVVRRDLDLELKGRVDVWVGALLFGQRLDFLDGFSGLVLEHRLKLKLDKALADGQDAVRDEFAKA